MDPREETLPKWAQALITRLRSEKDTALEPAVQARRKLEASQAALKRSQEVLSALQELLFAAAKSGHRTSEEIIKVLESYEIFPVKVEQ